MTNIVDIYSIIQRLRSVSKSTDKGQILSEEKDNIEFITLINYVYDEVAYTYNKSKVPKDAVPSENEFTNDEINQQYESLINMIMDFNSEELKGKAADNAMIELVSNSSYIIKDLLECILKRDLKCKVGARAINKYMGDIVNIAPYMRCESEKFMEKRIIYSTDGVNHGALAQTKEDGAFVNIELDSNWEYDSERFIGSTRKGRPIKGSTFLNSLNLITQGIEQPDSHNVLHGELLLKGPDGKLLPREIGNGRINSWINRTKWIESYNKKLHNAKTDRARNTLINDYADHCTDWEYTEHNMVYVVWDVVNYNEWKKLYSPETTIDRFLRVAEYVKFYNEFIVKQYLVEQGIDIGNCELRLVNSKIVKNSEEAMAFYNAQLDAGLEGMVIKNLHAPWMHDTNINGIVKLKDFFECDLLVTGWKYGNADGEFSTGIGSLTCESFDSKLQVDVSGMSREQRGFTRVDENDSSKGIKLIENFDFDWAVGKIITVKFNSMIKGEDKDTYSLFLPSMIEVRSKDDKSTADSLEKIAANSKFKLK